jgi:hypothetical protein
MYTCTTIFFEIHVYTCHVLLKTCMCDMYSIMYHILHVHTCTHASHMHISDAYITVEATVMHIILHTCTVNVCIYAIIL